MAGKINARKVLSTVRPDKSFWIHNGPIINNIKNLPKAVEQMTDDQFRHHVNKEKNDFSNWIKEILGDSQLATDIKKTRTRPTFVKKVKTRIVQLQKLKG